MGWPPMRPTPRPSRASTRPRAGRNSIRSSATCPILPWRSATRFRSGVAPAGGSVLARAADVVLPLAGAIHPLATAGLDSVGIRYHGLCRKLIRAFGRPCRPSANTSGKISAPAPTMSGRSGDMIELILNAGSQPSASDRPSSRSRTARSGCCGRWAPPRISRVSLGRRSCARRAKAGDRAPGMLASHYAPGAAVRLDARDVSHGEALIPSVPLCRREESTIVLDLSASGDLSKPP